MASDDDDYAASLGHDDDADDIAATQAHDEYVEPEDTTLAIFTLIESDGGHSLGEAKIKSMHIERSGDIDTGYVVVGKLPLFKARGIQDYKLPVFLSHIENAHAQHLYLHDMKRPAGSQPANRVQAILRYISSPEGLQWSVRDCSEVSLPSGRVTWIFRGEERRRILVSHNEWTPLEDKDEMQFLNTARE